MSREAEEFYRRENQKARREAFSRNMEIIGKGISGVANFFAERKQKKEQKRIEEAGERLAVELGVEDTGTLYPEFETALYGTAACLVTVLAKKTNRLEGADHLRVANELSRLAHVYIGSQPLSGVIPLVLKAKETPDPSPQAAKRLAYWDALEAVAKREVELVLSKGDKVDLEKVIQVKAKEVGDFGQNEAWLTGLFYACAAFLVYPTGEASAKGMLLLEQLAPLLALDDEAANEILGHACENADTIRGIIDPTAGDGEELEEAAEE